VGKLTLKLEVVTPCFLGGSTRGGPAEWRAQSVRGQLRWWLRAVAGGRYRGELAKVRELEAEIFGTTDRSSALRVRALGTPRISKAQQSCNYGDAFGAQELAKMWGDPSTETVKRLHLTAPSGKAFKTNPVHYLAYGPVVKGDFVQSAIVPEQEVELVLHWRRRVGEEARELFDLALWAWLNLGGIGSRSRKGFGSLRCVAATRGGSQDKRLKENLAPIGSIAWRERARECLALLRLEEAQDLAEWSHFTSASRIYIGAKNYTSWQEALEHLGAWLMAFRRRYGSPGDSRVYDGLQLAGRDYQWAKKPGASGSQVPDKAGFGLPLAFRFLRGPESSVKREGGGNNGRGNGRRNDKDSEARRASPLLLHVAMFSAGAYCPVLTHLPARLLPEGQRTRLAATGGHPATPWDEPTEEQKRVVEHFLTDLATKKLIEEVKG